MTKLLIILFIVISGCGKANKEYFPLGIDLRWEYIIEEKLNDKVTLSKSIVSNLDSKSKNGIAYFPRRYANGETVYFSEVREGILRSPYPDLKGEIVLGNPLKLGTTWQTGTRIEILDSRHESFSGGEAFISQADQIMLDAKIVKLNDTVKVAAGTFSNCLRVESHATVTVEARTRGIDSILIDQTEWYARGVGLVKRIREERSMPEKYAGKQVMQLVSLKN